MPTEKAAIEASVDQYTDDLSSEVVDVVQSVESVVDRAADAATPTRHIGNEVYAIFDALAAGNRALAAQAVLELLDGDTRDAAQRVIQVARDVHKELENMMKEIADVAQTIDNGVAALDDEIAKIEIPNDLLGY